jgi:hypothetical protein
LNPEEKKAKGSIIITGESLIEFSHYRKNQDKIVSLLSSTKHLKKDNHQLSLNFSKRN